MDETLLHVWIFLDEMTMTTSQPVTDKTANTMDITKLAHVKYDNKEFLKHLKIKMYIFAYLDSCELIFQYRTLVTRNRIPVPMPIPAYP